MTFLPLRRGLCLSLLTGMLCQCASPVATTLPADAPAHATLHAPWYRATARLAATVPTDENGRPIRWQFSVLNAPGINARSWPGGRLEVTSGTLAFAKNEAELAAVAAHEMAHVYCQDGKERALESWATILGGIALGSVLAYQDGDTAAAAGLASGAVLTFSLTALTARQREQEFGADRMSIDLLRRAGYPPMAAVTFWERYAKQRSHEGLGRPGWWKPHPPDAERVRRLRELATAG